MLSKEGDEASAAAELEGAGLRNNGGRDVIKLGREEERKLARFQTFSCSTRIKNQRCTGNRRCGQCIYP